MIGWWTDKAGRWADRQVGRQTGWWADRLVGGQAGGWAARWAGGLVGKHTCTHDQTSQMNEKLTIEE